jgi:hypothetical protein
MQQLVLGVTIANFAGILPAMGLLLYEKMQAFAEDAIQEERMQLEVKEHSY